MTERIWQLEMFQRSLKKRQKLRALLQLIGRTDNQRCLLVTCGDNNGALNWYFREHGGHWAWADVTDENLDEMRALLNEPVESATADHLPFADNQFDCVVSIDVLEHLDQDQPFLAEIRRVLRPGGRAVVTVPNGDPKLLANRIKWWVGMTPEVYGHTRAGYTVAELSHSLQNARLEPLQSGGYSRFFTEMLELGINYTYVFLLSRKKKDGHIAPTSSGELKTHGAAYRIYGLLFPIMNVLSQLDRLLPASINNAVIVTATKGDNG